MVVGHGGYPAFALVGPLRPWSAPIWPPPDAIPFLGPQPERDLMSRIARGACAIRTGHSPGVLASSAGLGVTGLFDRGDAGRALAATCHAALAAATELEPHSAALDLLARLRWKTAALCARPLFPGPKLESQSGHRQPRYRPRSILYALWRSFVTGRSY